MELTFIGCDYLTPLNASGNPPGLLDTWNYSQSFCIASTEGGSGFNPTTTIASTSDVQIYGYMSSGEVLISALIFCLILLQISYMIARGLSKLKTSKKYLAYHGGDVEIRDDL